MSNRVKPNYIIRELRLSDCEEVRQIWSEVGFELSKYTNEMIINIDSKGLLVAQDVDSDKIIGVICGLNISPDLAFIGEYAVRTEYRGLGIGTELWQKILEHLGPDRNLSLFSLPAMSDKYRDKSGFKIVSKNTLATFVGKPNLDKLIDSIDGISLQSINEDNIKSVVKYDKSICDGIDRTALIRQISKTPDSVNLVAINQKQEILGYCAVWATNLIYAISEPLYADNEKIAELLLGNTCRLMPITSDNGLIYVCRTTNDRAIAIANKLGLKRKRESPVQFTKALAEGNLDKIFCVSSRCCYPF